MEFLQRATIPFLKMSVRPVFRSVYFAGLFLLVTIASCDSSVSFVMDPAQDQDPGTDENPLESVMTAAIEGNSWEASSPKASDVRINGDVFLRIRGVSAVGDAVTLLFKRPIDLKTYVIREEALEAQQYRVVGTLE